FGALAAALTVATFGSPARNRRFIATGVMVVSAALVGLSWAFTLSRALICCALVGFGLILFFSTSQAMVQLSAADHNRGRLLGIWAMVLSGAIPLGNLISGPAADAWGEPVVLRFQGLLCLVGALSVLLIIRPSRSGLTPQGPDQDDARREVKDFPEETEKLS